MKPLALEKQKKKLEDILRVVKQKELSLAEGRRLASDLYILGQVFPEHLQLFDEQLTVLVAARKGGEK